MTDPILTGINPAADRRLIEDVMNAEPAPAPAPTPILDAEKWLPKVSVPYDFKREGAILDALIGTMELLNAAGRSLDGEAFEAMHKAWQSVAAAVKHRNAAYGSHVDAMFAGKAT